MANSLYRVKIPTNPEELLNLGSNILKRHTELGDSSPLNTLIANSWAVNGPKVAEGIIKHQNAMELSRKAEVATKERNILLPDITESIKASRDLLLGVYRDNPKKLSEFGFEVSNSTRAVKKKQA